MSGGCGCGIEDPFQTLEKAVRLRTECEDTLLSLRVPIAKASVLNPFRQNDFVRLEARLTAKLIKAFNSTASDEMDTLLALIKGVDLAKPESVQFFIAESSKVLKGLDRAVAREVTPVLSKAIDEMYKAANLQTSKDLLDTGKSTDKRLLAFGGRDERVIDLLNKNQAFHVSEGYRNRISDFDTKIRGTLNKALEEGWSRPEVAKGLTKAMGSTIQDENYWNIVGSTWLNRSRNWGALEAMSEAGIEQFVIIAVMDERTSPICRTMNGKTFSVGKQIAIMEESAQSDSLDELKASTPWLTSRKDEDGKEVVGLWRSNGRFSELYREGVAQRSEGSIQKLGVALPPYHGLCRTTVGVA